MQGNSTAKIKSLQTVLHVFFMRTTFIRTIRLWFAKILGTSLQHTQAQTLSIK